jgi:hypothetical protein
MDKTNFDLILEALKENCNIYDDEGQHRDVDLICNLLWLKYNCLELPDISLKLTEKIRECLNKKQLWFTNY